MDDAAVLGLCLNSIGKDLRRYEIWKQQFLNENKNTNRQRKFFKIEPSSLNKETLKKNYRTMMTQYHPDKINNLADEFKELAVNKSKEINEKYEMLLSYL